MQYDEQEQLDICIEALLRIAAFRDLYIDGSHEAKVYSSLAFDQLAEIAVDALESAGVALPSEPDASNPQAVQG